MTHSKQNKIRLSEDGSVVEYLDSKTKLLWSAALGNIVLMAEYTTDEAPDDDYFLVFVTAEDGRHYFSTGSFYANGCDEVIERLADYWGQEEMLDLAGSRQWASRVVWPPRLVGEEYLELRELAPKNFFEKLQARLYGPDQEYLISQSVRDFLALEGGNPAELTA